MVVHFLTKTGQNTPINSFIKSFKTKFATLFLLLFISACTDQGCIEADDFGEYEYETLTVKASGAAQSCIYDYSLPIDDDEQGTGLHEYLTASSVTVTTSELDDDGNLKSYTSDNTGCSYFGDGTEARTNCILDAINECRLKNQATGLDADPGWLATDERQNSQNAGITLYPDSEILISAEGKITLGEQKDYQSHYISPVQTLPTSHPDAWRDSNIWQHQIFDVTQGQTLRLEFSGQWHNGTELIGAGPDQIQGTVDDQKIYNAAKRTVAYLTPLPFGYEYDYSKTTEAEGSIGTPLRPSPNLWTCDYPAANPNEPDCYSNSYMSVYTDNVNFTAEDDERTQKLYPVTAQEPSPILGYHGGMIRWKNDGVQNSSMDPFAGGATPTSIAEGGIVLGDIELNNKVITNGQAVSYQVAFRATDANCEIPIDISIQKDGVNTQSYGSPLTLPNTRTFPVNTTLNSNWSTVDLAIEPDQDLVISAIGDIKNTLGNNCGQSIQVRFIPYHEITIVQSGLVSFKMLNGIGTESCTLSGSIINPEGSHFDVVNSDPNLSNVTSDFYEYNPLTATSPLYSLIVNDASWTTPIFVRKGQKIRFNPQSWDGTWLSGDIPSQTVNCGIGMAMKIEARPALLCRGKRQIKVDNPLCIQDYDNGELVGCVADEESCYNPDLPIAPNGTPGENYCPPACQAKITCTNGDESNNYTKSCTATAPPADGVDDCEHEFTTAPFINSSTCGSVDANNIPISGCALEMYTQGTRSAKIYQETDQCYNLEDFKGKVANIDVNEGFSTQDLDDPDIAKGTLRLGSFNGSFGNLDGFTKTLETDAANNNNTIYRVNAPLIFSQAGRLEFFLLDGDNFYDMFQDSDSNNGGDGHYEDNSLPGTNYSGTNGMRIDISGALEFFNGEMMSAVLCNEKSGVCKGDVIPVALNPTLTEFGPDSEIQIGGKYQFLKSGTLVRKEAVDKAFDCGHSSVSGIENNTETTSTSNFYCHTQDPDDVKHYRLTFKIIDPENGDCDASDPISGTNLDGITQENPYYKEDDPNADPVISGNDGAMCDTANKEQPLDPATDGHTTCYKEFYCANKYINNNGEYKVTIKVKKPDGSKISNVIGGVVNPVIEVLDGPKDGSEPSQVKRIYTLLIADGKYQMILSLALATMVTFYGLGTLMGVNELTHSELLSRLLKIGIIYLFVSPQGWHWFNELFVSFFKGGTDYLAFMMASSFDNSESISKAIETGDYYDKSILFESVDKVFNMFFSDAVQKKISGLLFADIFGIVYLWIIYLAFMLYVYAVCNAVLLYLTAQVFISILFIIGPLFFIFLIFDQTKEMFDNWLKQLISFSLQQIFLLTTLAFFNMMMYEVIKMSLGYKVCWDVVWTIKVFGPVIELMSFWTIPSESPGSAGSLGDPSGDVPSLFTILFIWVVASLMNKFIGFMTDVASSISGGLKASELGSGVKQAFNEFNKYAKSRASDAYKGSIGKQVERLDAKLFDSGEIAKKARRARKEQNSKDAATKGVLTNARKAAVKNYLDENMAEYSSMDKTEKKQKLREVENEAIAAKGKAMGLSEKEIDRVMKSTSTYEGSNAIFATVHAGKQLKEKLKEMWKGDDTSIDKKDLDKAIKNAKTNEERNKIVENFKEGNLKVKRSTMGKLKGALGGARKAVGNAGRSVKNGTVMSDTASAASSAWSSATNSKAARMMKNAVGKGEWAQSKKQLIAEGKVPDEAILSEEDNALVEERIRENRQTRRDKDGKAWDMKSYRKAEKELIDEGAKLEDGSEMTYQSFEDRQNNPEQMAMIEERMKQNEKAQKVDKRIAAHAQRKADKHNKKHDVQQAKEKVAELAEDETATEEDKQAAKEALREASDTYKKQYSKKGKRNPVAQYQRRQQKKAQKKEAKKDISQQLHEKRKEQAMQDSGVQEAYSSEENQGKTPERIREDLSSKNKQNRQQNKAALHAQGAFAGNSASDITAAISGKGVSAIRSVKKAATSAQHIAKSAVEIATFGTVQSGANVQREQRNERSANKAQARAQSTAQLKQERKELKTQKSGAQEVDRFAQFEQSKDAATKDYEEAKEVLEALSENLQNPDLDSQDRQQIEQDMKNRQAIIDNYEKVKVSTKGKRLGSATQGFDQVHALHQNRSVGNSGTKDNSSQNKPTNQTRDDATSSPLHPNSGNNSDDSRQETESNPEQTQPKKEDETRSPLHPKDN